MKVQTKRILPAMLAVIGLMAAPAWAGDESDWNNLSQIRAGEKVQVVRQKMKTVNGNFESFSGDSIVVRQKAADVVIPKGEVVRVTITGRSHRLRNLAIGAAVGAGTGLLIGQIITRERNDDWQTIAYFCTVVGLGGGTGIGAAMPAHPTVYRAVTPFPPAK
ncbi:MAG TPA: hypothetical protein PLZ95_05965 [Bryobacteraceae bacterium]|nr:hypothetical protein [Bryobacteraceae bacterium]